MHKVAIVTPVYRPTLSDSEKLSIRLRDKYLSNYDFIAITPKSLARLPFEAKQLDFADVHFKSVADYSRLLLTREFYAQFTQYEYILIYQLDALVLKNEMEYWCKQKLSYIGAPWFHSLIGLLTTRHRKLRGGNGGFSLRRIPDFLRVLDRTDASRYPFNEDGFWSFKAPKIDPQFNAATFEQSLAFAFEDKPRKCFKLNGNRLPFGVHAWEKYDKQFWLERIKPLL